MKVLIKNMDCQQILVNVLARLAQESYFDI